MLKAESNSNNKRLRCIGRNLDMFLYLMIKRSIAIPKWMDILGLTANDRNHWTILGNRGAAI